MRRLFNFLAKTAMILLAALTVSSCDEEELTYTVRFDSKGGTPTPQEQIVMKGGKVTKPTDPIHDNYEFVGWTKTDNETSAFWNFETETVNKDMTLYARWSIITHLVTFDSDGGSEIIAQNVTHGNKATKPIDPTKDGYEFDGWFNGDMEWDFSNTVTAPIILKAKWADSNPPKLDFSNDEIRKDISSYLRASFRQWKKQANSDDLKNVDENYMKFLRSIGISDYLTDKLSKNNELAVLLFDGMKAEYSKEEHASICREILRTIDTYETLTFIGYGFLQVIITCDYPLRVENVYNKVLEKYSNANSSTIPTDLNNTLQAALLEEVKSGLPLSVIYGRCQLDIRFNTMTGEVLYADFYNGGYGEMEKWSTSPTSILISGSGRPYDNLWTDLWNAVRNDLNVTYTSQNMELQNWNVLYLDLHLSGYNPFKYKLVVYILVGSSWWIKPQWGRSFPVGFDTQYHIWTQTGGYDNTATKAAAMILPIDSDVNIDNYAAAKAVAVNYKEINR